MLFLHSKHPINRVTVGGEFIDGKLCLTAARCGGKDNFSRKKGRLIVQGRFLKGKTLCVLDVVEPTYQTFVVEATKLAELVHQDMHYKTTLL